MGMARRKEQQENRAGRNESRRTAACGKARIAVAPVLRRRGLVVSRTVGPADDGEWVKGEMARGHKAPDQGLQCNRVDRNQRCGFPDQECHGETS